MKGATFAKLKAEGRCRLCLRPASARPLTRHRVVPGHLGGLYVPDNVVPLCRPCHDLVDNLGDGDDRRRYRRMLRATLWPVEVAHALARLRGGFDRLYPPPARERVLEARRGSAPAGGTDRPRHLRHCKASAGGCVAGCPVDAVRGVA